MRRRIILGITLVVVLAAYIVLFLPAVETEPLRPGNAERVTLLPFAENLSLDPLPDGWTHRTFWFTPPMVLSNVTQAGQSALRCATDGGGSILTRAVDIPLDVYTTLEWDWFVNMPVTSDLDERTEEGDDHPARLFLRFADVSGPTHATEIIWGNRELGAGDNKVLGDFYHLVANGGDVNVGRWHQQDVDLQKLYRDSMATHADLMGRGSEPRLIEVGIFCDTDQTGGQSVAYFGNVDVTRP